MRRIVTLLAVGLLSSAILPACASHAHPPSEVSFDLRELILTRAGGAPSDGDYWLDLDRTMQLEHVDRQVASEIQAGMRALLKDPKRSILEAYIEARVIAQRGEGPSGWKGFKFESPADFVVGIDATSPEPGLVEWGKRLRANPRCRGIFAFVDSVSPRAKGEASSRVSGIDGVFVFDHRALARGTRDPIKDLRVIDESLEHVVMVDTHPLEVTPATSVRGRARGLESKAYVESRALLTTAKEIEEASAAALKLGISFSRAFYPYSQAGNAEFRALAESFGPVQARAKMRAQATSRQ